MTISVALFLGLAIFGTIAVWDYTRRTQMSAAERAAEDADIDDAW